MKQSYFNFILFWKRVEEVKRIRERSIGLKVNLDVLNFNSIERRTIDNLLEVTTNLKNFYFINPSKKHLDIKDEVRALQYSLHEHFSSTKNEDKIKYFQKIYKMSEDYFRIDEMVEQNIMFWSVIILFLLGVVLPPIFANVL